STSVCGSRSRSSTASPELRTEAQRDSSPNNRTPSHTSGSQRGEVVTTLKRAPSGTAYSIDASRMPSVGRSHASRSASITGCGPKHATTMPSYPSTTCSTVSSVQYALTISSKRPSIDSGPALAHSVSTSTPSARAAALAEAWIVAVIERDVFGLITSKRVIGLYDRASVYAHLSARLTADPLARGDRLVARRTVRAGARREAGDHRVVV